LFSFYRFLYKLKAKGLPKQALKHVDSLYQQAKKDQNSVQKVKSLIMMSNFIISYQRENENIIDELKAEINNSKGAEKAMLLVALSDEYHNYYQKRSWSIRNRSEIHGKAPENIGEWSQSNFKITIDSLLQEALTYRNELKKETSLKWKEVFYDDKGDFRYQPTLYDFVIWHTIEFYSQNNFCSDAQEDLVLLNDSLLYIDFSNYNLSSLPSSNKKQILQLFQELTLFHSKNKDISPLLFTEAKRLKYLQENGIIDLKTDLISNQYEKLFEQYNNDKGVNIIAQYLVDHYMNYYKDNENKLKRADKICGIMVDHKISVSYFKNAQKYLNRTKLSLLINDAILPNKKSFAKIDFQNIQQIWFKIIPIDKSLYIQESIIEEKVFNKKPVKEYSLVLASENHLANKSALIEIPELNYGRYAIIANSSPDFSKDIDQIVISTFWVSRIHIISRKNDHMYLVIDRETGKPMKGAQVNIFANYWHYSENKKKLIETIITNKDGEFRVNTGKNLDYIGFEVNKDQDEWRTSNYNYDHKHDNKTREKHYFFTDRAIYRPGQTVYFKGILTEQKGNKVEPIADKQINVQFFGANGKELQNLQLTSNKFGSVSGHFICPLSGLTGNMRISDKKGSVRFRMEEYKRPKFEVELNTPNEEYCLNEVITVIGQAHYYAGVGVENAKIKYRVIRTGYMPWRWTYYPKFSQEITIAAGEINSDKDGTFEIKYPAIAPKNKTEEILYNYQLIVEVTDGTGETHTQNMGLRIGNQSLYISADLPKKMDNQKPKDVLIKAQTPNGRTINREVIFKLEKLKTPIKIIKNPLWETDTIIISNHDLLQQFHVKTDIRDLAPEATILIKTLQTETDSIIPKSIFRSLSNGAYKMTLSCKDKNANEVIETAFVEIFSTQSNEMPFVQDDFFFINKNTAHVGETISFSFGSSFKKQNYYYQLSSGNTIIHSAWGKLSNELNHLSIPIKEEYRGGLSIQVFFEKDNRIYSYSKRITIPFDNKKLKVKLVTLQNPMSPGQKENWKLLIESPKGNEFAAEIMAGMYDASLDVFESNNWTFWPYHSKRTSSNWQWLKNRSSYFINYKYNYPHRPHAFQSLQLIWDNYYLYGRPLISKDHTSTGATVTREEISNLSPVVENDMDAENLEYIADKSSGDSEQKTIPKKEATVSPRKNLQETAFFYPQLTTDKDGYVQLHFTSPEALSKWKLMVLATTKDMEIGSLTQEFTTQKELMVMPNLPRFLRGGDHITISTKIINLLNEEQNIKAELEILDAKTMQAIHILDENDLAEQSISIKSKGQVTVHWELIVPEEVGAVVIRILAKGDKHQDGEEHILPVLSQLQFLTDTHPFTLSGNQILTPKDLKIKGNGYKENDELTLEITTHPLWYVVQALPNYTPPQNPAALNWFQYYFINSMASSIIKNNPQIETVFRQWQMNNSDELKSELEQNQELKQILIEETPWVLNAENQSKRKQQIAQLFDKNTLEYNLSNSIDKLKELQKPNGSWSWYHGMRESVYITAGIVKGMGQLKKDDIISFKKYHPAKAMTYKAIKYLDLNLIELHEKVLAYPNRYGSYHANRMIEARAFFYDDVKMDAKTQEAYHYFLDIWKREWQESSLMEQVRVAKVLLLSHQTNKAQEILLSLKDRSLEDEFGGIYWRGLVKYSAAKNQAAMIELFEMTETDKAFVNGLKTWLLEQKRANDWGNGKATAQACYALLKGSNALNHKSQVFLTINGHTEKVEGNAGTGYYKMTWSGDKIQEILKGLKIKTEGEGLVFGAFYHQYFEKISEIKAHEGGVEVEKKVFVAKTKNGKNELFRLSESSPIELGDRILVRLTLNNKQAMDFVHLRDYLPAGFENQNPLSGFYWQGNIGFYQSPRDIATDYFIHHLPKGEFVIEYELNATSAGVLNIGPAKIQSLYAPEFGGRSMGGVINVE